MRSIELTIGSAEIGAYGVYDQIKTSTFPAGEPYLKLQPEHFEKPYPSSGTAHHITLNAYISTPEQIFQLLLTKDALDNLYPGSTYTLNLPYIPFGRQDRVVSLGEPFSLRVFAKLLNDMKFDKVITTTPHSDVSGALIERLDIRNDFRELEKYLKANKILGKDIDPPVFVAPDAGAMKRIYYAAMACNIEDVICATKIRNAKTGEVVSVNIPEIEDGRNLVVIDDICDGGATFIELEKHLPKSRKSLTLYVTHGIFSKGRKVLHDAGYDNVGSTFDFLENKIVNTILG